MPMDEAGEGLEKLEMDDRGKVSCDGDIWCVGVKL